MKLLARGFWLSVLIAVVGVVPVMSQESGAVRFLKHFVPPQGGAYVAGCWGWTDTVSNREYAVLGSYCGTSIVEITDAENPVERDFIPGPCSIWREIQVHENYAYVVTEAGGGTQIIDLSALPDSARLVKSFTYTLGGKNTSRVHTNHIKDGYLYLNGCGNWSPGGAVIFSLADPENPSYLGSYDGTYFHDSFARGDTLFGAGIYGDGPVIVNTSDKSNPTFVSSISYSGAGTHNLATTEDGRYLLTTDEIGSTPKTLKIWSLTEAPIHQKVAEYQGDPSAIVHNVFVKGDIAYMSYYTAGIKIVDISDPTNPFELGGYDTYTGSGGGYDGAWSVYPFFPSGKIIIGDMATGLYLVDLATEAPRTPSFFDAYSDYTTPTSVQLTWDDPGFDYGGDTLKDFTIHIYRDDLFLAAVDSGIEFYSDSGLTLHEEYQYSIRAVTSTDSSATVASTAYAGGHAQPATPSSFQVTESTEGAVLYWTNPRTQEDGTPLNDLGTILFYRNDILFDSLSQSSSDTGATRSYTDTLRGYHTYSIRARDTEDPQNFSDPSSSVFAFAGIMTSYSDDFESGIGPVYTTGSWGVTSASAASGSSSITDSPGANYPNSTTATLLTPPVILGTDAMLQFSHVALVAVGDFAYLEISTNHAQSFSILKVYNLSSKPGWSDGTVDDGDWFTETRDLSAYAGDTVVIRFRLYSNSSVNSDGWYLDDITLGPSNNTGSASVEVTEGWNMLSLPVEVLNATAATVFPTAASQAFRYRGGYTSLPDTLESGVGYWVKFDSAQSFELTGGMMRRDTLELSQRWNLIGMITDRVDTAGLKVIPSGILSSPFYSFDGNGYVTVSALDPGKAYWVKSTVTGKLVLSNFNARIASSSQGGYAVPERASAFTVRDNEGHARSLFVATGSPDGSPDRFELPPAPPAGVFDVRFASDRFVEYSSADSPAPLSISIASARYPVTIDWDVLAGAGFDLVVDGRSRVAVSGKGVATISHPGSLTLEYNEHSGVPARFSLEQNYPNPFNPSTSIRFSLPEPADVRLRVFNVYGQEVAELINGHLSGGSHEAVFSSEGSTNAGDSRSHLASGVYYISLEARGASANYSSTQKCMLLK